MYPLFLFPLFYLDTQDMIFCLIEDKQLEEGGSNRKAGKVCWFDQISGEIGQNVLTGKLCYYAQRK